MDQQTNKNQDHSNKPSNHPKLQPKTSTTTTTITIASNDDNSFLFRCCPQSSSSSSSPPSNGCFLKWFLLLWLLIGICFYILDIFFFTSTIKYLFNFPSNLVFLLAILNNLLMIVAISLQLRIPLIISILIDCALLVAIPALIVEVIPNLLTYSLLMISIIMSIVYGVLYMRDPNEDYYYYNNNDNHTDCRYNYLDGASRISYNCPRSNGGPSSVTSAIGIGSPTIPRHSCQF